MEKYLLRLPPDSKMNLKAQELNKELVHFFLLAYIISWLIWGTIIIFPEKTAVFFHYATNLYGDYL